MPLLSIITINRNNAQGLKKTIESVVTQTETDFNDIEYIIIDGNSTDGSKDIIKEFAGNPEYKDKITYWVSEPDTGIYNAMNKGIKKATGDYCLFLNSGDYLIDNVLKKILDELKKDNKTDIFYTDIPQTQDHKQCNFPKKLDYIYFLEQSIYHQGTFIRTNLFNKIGSYSENYKIVSDWEFFLKAFEHKARFKHLGFYTTFFEWNGVSSDKKFKELHDNERNEVIQKVLGKRKLFFIRTKRFIQKKPKIIIEKIKRRLKYRYRKSIDKYFINLCYGNKLKQSTYKKLNKIQKNLVDYILNDEFYNKSIANNNSRINFTNNYLKNQKKETISVVIPHYNHQSQIKKTVESILNQTLQAHEIIIVDDMSDNIELTKSTLDPLADDSKIKVIYSNKKLYPAGARNLGASLATGDIIQFFDADDIMHPQRLEITQITFNLYDNISSLMTGNTRFDDDSIHFPNIDSTKIKENIINPQTIIQHFSIYDFSKTKLSFLDENNSIPGWSWGGLGIKGKYSPTLGHLAILKDIRDILEYHQPQDHVFTPCEDYEYCVFLEILTLGLYQLDLPLSYYRSNSTTWHPQNKG